MLDGKPVIVGLGEVLYDMLPDGRQLGGAPVNVACHACSLGADGIPVSCVGSDDNGRDLRRDLKRLGMPVDYVSVSDDYPTGTVDIDLDDNGVPSYTIHRPVAWDALVWTRKLESLAQRTDAVCFGTLAQREAQSRQVIRKFVISTGDACLRVYDVNLRQEDYCEEVVRLSLHISNVVKLNHEELPVILKFAGIDPDTPDPLRDLCRQWQLRTVALTRGGEGSTMVSGEASVTESSRPVGIVDTVGAGDAFTAAMTLGLLNRHPLPVVNRAAARVAEYVCAQPGATPALPPDLVEKVWS